MTIHSCNLNVVATQIEHSLSVLVQMVLLYTIGENFRSSLTIIIYKKFIPRLEAVHNARFN